MIKKICKQCKTDFVIEDADLAFYKKISPTFDGKTFNIPEPTLCPDCRRQKRIACRNVTKLYKRKSDHSGREIVSPYAPNSRNVIYDVDEYYSDSWDPIDYGKDFDFNRTFFEQFNELYLEVPLMGRNVLKEENSPFTNNGTGMKNCYLLQNSNYSEDCFYGIKVNYSRDCIDNYICVNSENCYECINVENCYSCLFSNDSSNCRDSVLLDNCISCKDCYGCANLLNKQYYLFNKPSTKEEVEQKIKLFLKAHFDERKTLIDDARKFLSGEPKRFAHVLKSENVTGDYISNSKDISEGFMIHECENLRYCHNIVKSKDSMDYDIWGNNSSYIYNCDEVGEDSRNIYFCRMIEQSSNLFYSISMYSNCKNCFGCTGLSHKEYCIFNKQYSPEEYEKLAARIAEHMQETGEWGEYFPIDHSPYSYNESLAQDYYPLTKEEAIEIGAKWQDDDFNPNYVGEEYVPEQIENYKGSQEKVDQALSGVLKCEVTGKPFRLQAKELAFYIKNSIQIPRKHPDQRYVERFELTNPIKTWHRKCMNDGCEKEFETTYAPDRPERVFCEKCYQESVI